MNALELYNAWEVFSRLMNDPAFEAKVKHEMGREFLRSLPSEMLCPFGKSSRDAIVAAMKGRLTDMERELNGRGTNPEAQEAPKRETKGRVQSKTRS